MKPVYLRTLIALFLSSLTLACTEITGNLKPAKPDTQENEISTDVGQPIGAAVTKMIGPEGGTIASADGTVQLTLPAGALSAPTPISIQPITNETPNGIGQAYRFLPHGTTFAKAGTLTFKYEKDQVSYNNPDAFLVAYQKEDGIWYNVGGARTDTTSQRITVPMAHFSDWSAAELAQIENMNIDTDYNAPDILYWGESMTLHFNALAPLVNEGSLKYKNNDESAKWTVVGGRANGTLSQTVGSSTTYKAHMGHSTQNPVTVTAEITFTNGKKVILVKEILVGTGYMKLRFGGKTYTLLAVLDDGYGTYFDVSGATLDGGGAYCEISVNATQPGVFAFNKYDEVHNTSGGEIRIGNGKSYYTTGYDCDGHKYEALGEVFLEKYQVGKIAKGTFSGHIFTKECVNSKTDGPVFSGEFYARPSK